MSKPRLSPFILSSKFSSFDKSGLRKKKEIISIWLLKIKYVYIVREKKYTREYGRKKEVDDDDTEIKYVEKWKKEYPRKP